MLLSILVMTSPGPDVWPSILTDYTYDSELDIADGVPRSVSTQLDVPGGEHSCTTEHWPPYHHLWLKCKTAHYLWSNYFKSCASVRMSLVIWRICGYHIKADLLHQEPLTVRRTFNKVYIMKNVISKPHICRYGFDSAVSFDKE